MISKRGGDHSRTSDHRLIAKLFSEKGELPTASYDGAADKTPNQGLATSATFDEFVESGWDADGSASAAAGDEGLNAKASFVNGMAVFQMTKKGLIAQASVKGTKYWKDEDLNK